MEIRNTKIVKDGVRQKQIQEKQISVNGNKINFYINSWGCFSVRVFLSKDNIQSDTHIVFTKEETDELEVFLLNNKEMF